METNVISDNDDLDDVLPNSESELFISSSNSGQNNYNKKISSKIIDALDVDWSILSNKSVNTSSTTNNLDYLRPSYILSTIGVLKECLDDKTTKKIKEFIDKDDNKLVKDLKSQNILKNKVVNNSSFNNSGICMRNDIERRKALYFSQINNHLDTIQTTSLSGSFSNEDIYIQNNGFISNHLSFHQYALQLSKMIDDDNI